MIRSIRSVFFLSLLVAVVAPAWAGEGGSEYRVVILQGITAGGTVEKQAAGIYVDTKRTRALNDLAAEGWEVVAVIGAPGMDHAVYLRRD